MKNKISLQDLYKFQQNEDGSFILSQDEYERFIENFDDYLQIRYAIKSNAYAKDQYDKLYIYSKWFNDI